jgi:hypothetical protein
MPKVRCEQWREVLPVYRIIEIFSTCKVCKCVRERNGVKYIKFNILSTKEQASEIGAYN